MLDSVLLKKTSGFRITVKTTISVLLVVMATALPQLTHALGGAQAGSVYMPMYMPALLAGLLLGWQWGLAVGMLSPIVSFGFTSLVFDSAMPNLTRLPCMILEIGVFGLVPGLLGARARKIPALAFPIVILGQLAGRTVYVIYNLISGRPFAELMSSVQTSILGLYLQAFIVPVIAIILIMVLNHEQKAE